jgi:hypothetical protein
LGFPPIAVVNRTSQCAGLNRYEAGEEESLRERSSDPLGPEFCVVAPRGSQRSVNRGIGGLGIELRKLAIRTPTQLRCAEGNMNRGDSASRWSVLRSRRPQSTPRSFIHENRETSETPVAEPSGRTAGEGQGRTTRMHVSEESDSGIVPMSHSNKDGKPLAESEEERPLIKENTHRPHMHPTQSGTSMSLGLASVRKASSTLRRHHPR